MKRNQFHRSNDESKLYDVFEGDQELYLGYAWAFSAEQAIDLIVGEDRGNAKYVAVCQQ